MLRTFSALWRGNSPANHASSEAISTLDAAGIGDTSSLEKAAGTQSMYPCWGALLEDADPVLVGVDGKGRSEKLPVVDNVAFP